MIKGAIFDFDGTLFDSMIIWDTAGEIYLHSVGKEAKENLQQVLKPLSLYQSACYLKETYLLTHSIPEILDGINKTMENFYLDTVLPKPGAIEFLRQLQSLGIRMCIATATEKYMVQGALKRCGMDSFFSGIFTCTDVGHGKDEPVIFREAMKHLNTDRSNTIVVEDAYHAIQTAKKDHFLTLAVYDSHEEKQKEIQEITDYYMKDFIQSEDFLKSALQR